MKKIDERFRHLPEEEALEATEDLRLREAAPAARNAFLKQDYYESMQERENFVRQDRRRFLDLVAKSGISAGLIKSSALLGGLLANRHVLAQDASNKRVVFCYVPSGSATGTFLPTSATQMNLVTTKYGPGTGNYDVASICHFRQVNVITSGHSTAMNSLGNTNYSTPTMDKRLADVLGSTTPRKSIYLGAESTNTNEYCSNIGPSNNSPSQALSDYFGSGSTSSSGSNDNTYALAYDAQLRALNSIKSRLSTTEAVRLEEHAASLTKIKTNLAAANSSSGGGTTTNCGTGINVGIEHIVRTGISQADIIVAALACGITKVATLQLGSHQGQWKGYNTNFTGVAHDAAHASPNQNNFVELNRYINEVPAYLIKKLRETNGPDGQPLIRSTVFVQVTCMGNGMTHLPDNAPFVLATEMSGFARGFTTRTGGDVFDLVGAIPKGLGISSINVGSNTLGLV